MKNEVWSVDLNNKLVTHQSGLALSFRGSPGTDAFGFALEAIPQDLSCLELARLMRLGVDYYIRSVPLPSRKPSFLLTNTA
jgi:hypothetical protein